MPALHADPIRPRRAKPSGLTDLEAALLDRIDDGQDRTIAAIDRLTEKAPSHRLVLAVATSMIVGVLALVVFLVSLVAEGRGIDTGAAASSTRVVMEAARGDGVVGSASTSEE